MRCLNEQDCAGGLNHYFDGLGEYLQIVSFNPTATTKAFFLPDLIKYVHYRINSANKEANNTCFAPGFITKRK